MKPLILCNDRLLLFHSVVESGLANPCLYAELSPFKSATDEAVFCRDYWLAHPNVPRAVELGWLGPEGFDIDRRDDNGALVGTTQADFDRGMTGKGFARIRDMVKCRACFDVWKAAGTLPTTVYINHEPQSTPPHTAPMPERVRFNDMRIAHFKAMLVDSGLYSTAKNIVISFTQFSTRGIPAWDYNGVRVPINKPRWWFRSNTQLYSANQYTTPLLSAWLAAVGPGAWPCLSANNAGMLAEQLDLCDYHKATAMIYLDEVLGGSPWWQAGQAEWVLANRGGAA